MDEGQAIVFAWGVALQKTPEGLPSWNVRVKNKGIPEEVALMLLRTWLRMKDDAHLDRMKGDYSGS